MSFKEIVDAVMKASLADQTEVLVLEQDDNLTRFANNCIHQNVTERNTQVTVRSVIGRRVGIAASNDVRPESLERLASKAYELARLQPENPEFKGLPGPKPISPAAAFDAETAECAPQRRAELVRVICRKSSDAGFTAAGSLRTIAQHIGVANSLGVFAESRTTIADVSTVVMGADSSGWAQQSSGRIHEINTESLADEAVRKTRLGANPVDGKPGEYTIILDPYATADIIAMLAFDGMGAMACQEERSWINGRLGQRIMDESITIVDDGLHPGGIVTPVDYEGVPKQRVTIVNAGVVQYPVYDSYTAGREQNRESTGHATPPSPSEKMGPLPMNLFLKPGSSSIEEMIQSTKLGLYITRFWYTRPVHPRDAVITGMTRDGTYLVENGEITQPLKSLRFTQSYVEALKNTESLGTSAHLLWSEFISICVPAIKIGAFRFTGGTR